MPSPFPGMDPYLEGYLWPDVHQALPTKLRQLLAPLVAPRYVARLEISIVKDTSSEKEAGIMYPDLEVLLERESVQYSSKQEPTGRGPASQITPSALAVPVLPVMRVKLVSVQLRTVDNNQLVTSIEIVSPVNKRQPGRFPYRKKRLKLIARGVHLIEIDLLRRGKRVIPGKGVPSCDYLLGCTRAGLGRTELWPLSVRDPLPVVPVPLLDPDADVPLKLGEALTAIYDEARYDLSIDYDAPPPPPKFGPEESKWMTELMRAK
jgi:hypothetical protein